MGAEAEEEEGCDPEAIEAKLRELKHQLAQVEGELSALETNYASLKCGEVLERGPLPDPFTWVACLRWRSRLIELRAEKARLLAQIEFAEQQLEECLRRRESQGASSLVTAMALTAVASASGSASFCTVTSWDPNDKIGVDGVGPYRYIAPNVPLPYTIHFENQATATAPATEVLISDQLPPNVDWSTLSFGAITFGTRVIDVPAGSNHFRTLVDLRPERELLVDVDAGVSQSGLVTVRLSSIDPLTGTPPTDPFAGFLPPNVSSPEGEGSVSFTVRTKAEVPNSSQIQNAATIVFDTNPALVTPQWINTVDAAKPMSRVGDLPAVQPTSTFTVTWSGSDEGAGLKTFDVFVSDNGGPFTLLLTDTPATSGTFTGVPGQSYSFFSIARDLVGNVESFKTEGETSTTIVIDVPRRRLTGSGYNFPEGTSYRASFSIDISGPSAPTGRLQYSYTRTRLNFTSTHVNSVAVDGASITIEGAGTVNGAPGYTFTARVTDGSPDAFGIVIRRPDGTTHFSTSDAALAGGEFTISSP